MSDVAMTKEQWVEVLEAAGIDARSRERWHREFERLHPEGHRAFLRWLHIPEEDVGRIRERSGN